MMSEETLRALIVDDEAPAREHLVQLLECHCNVKIVGEANSVATAAALSRDLQPNLIFSGRANARGRRFFSLVKA
jgi:two-component system, LytTR family, response regulator